MNEVKNQSETGSIICKNNYMYLYIIPTIKDNRLKCEEKCSDSIQFFKIIQFLK